MHEFDLLLELLSLEHVLSLGLVGSPVVLLALPEENALLLKLELSLILGLLQAQLVLLLARLGIC